MEETPLMLDYLFLKEQAIAKIYQLAGKKWTDYGDHDPGITILEALIFGVMDLEYRTNFYIEDIWAKHPDSTENIDEQPFYSAEEILPCNPLTKWDFLKLVLDVPSVKNANLFLSNEPSSIKGGYKIFVDVEERIRHTGEEKEVLEAVQERLYAHRNLCEDFFLIQPMQPKFIAIHATFEVTHCLAYEEGENIVAQILLAFQSFLSPRITFYSISQLLEKGKTIDQIFTGPTLTQGFIDDDELIALKGKSTIYVAELLAKATNVPGIKRVLDFELCLDASNIYINSVSLPLSPEQAFMLDLTRTKVILTYNALNGTPRMPIRIDNEKVADLLEGMKGRGGFPKAYLPEEEIFVLEGSYRHLEAYLSIQNDFPLLYNVGYEGCTPSESVQNHAKAKQLKSYLMFFDQLFANYLGQLSNVKNVLAVYSNNWGKPNGQLPLEVPQLETLLKDLTNNADVGDDLEFIIQKKYLDLKQEHLPIDLSIQEKESIAASRRHSYCTYVHKILESDIRSLGKQARILDHLLAYFSEQFMTYALHLYPKSEETQLHNLNDAKANFLKDYVSISRDRGRAAHWICKDKAQEEKRLCYASTGFKRRLCHNLGIKTLESGFLHEVIKHNLYAEKTTAKHQFDIFLGKNYQTEYADLLMFKGKYSNMPFLIMAYGINESNYNIIKNYDGSYHIVLYVDKIKKHTIEVMAVNHMLMSVEAAEHIIQESVDWFKSLNEQCEGFHIVEHILLRSSDVLEAEEDPYSFIMTMVFPAWPARFQQASFRNFVEKMVVLESPAHIYVNILWLDLQEMETFEEAYKIWLALKADPNASKAAVDAASQTLMRLITLYGSDARGCA